MSDQPPPPSGVRPPAYANPGWYSDPWTRFRSRYWDGQRWTDWAADGGAPFVDTVDAAEEAGHLRYTRSLVDAAAAGGAIDQRARRALVSLIDARGSASAPRRPVPVVRTPVDPRPAPRPSVTQPATPRPHPSAQSVRPVEPLIGPARRTWQRVTSVVAGDLA